MNLLWLKYWIILYHNLIVLAAVFSKSPASNISNTLNVNLLNNTNQFSITAAASPEFLKLTTKISISYANWFLGATRLIKRCSPLTVSFTPLRSASCSFRAASLTIRTVNTAYLSYQYYLGFREEFQLESFDQFNKIMSEKFSSDSFQMTNISMSNDLKSTELTKCFQYQIKPIGREPFYFNIIVIQKTTLPSISTPISGKSLPVTDDDKNKNTNQTEITVSLVPKDDERFMRMVCENLGSGCVIRTSITIEGDTGRIVKRRKPVTIKE